jgi:hypothetical protein
MKIRYSQLMGMIFLLVGVVLVTVYFLIVWNMKYGSTVQLLGFMGIFWGIVLLKRTYFFVDGKSLVIYAILGSSETKYELKSLDELMIYDNKLYLAQENGKYLKLNIQAGMAEKEDWQALRRKINSVSRAGKTEKNQFSGSQKPVLLETPSRSLKESINSFYTSISEQNRRRIFILILAYALLMLIVVLVNHIK